MSQSQRYRLHACAAMILAIGMSACSSNKGPDRTAKAVESFSNTRQKLDAASAQVGATNDSLKALTTAGSGDLRPLYDNFTKQVKKTQSMADQARDRAESMRAKADAYTTQWQKEFSSISDAEVRRMSEARATAAKADFDRVRSAASNVRAAYAPYREGLQDVQTFLANDLTAEGVRSITTKANETIRKGEALQKEIAALQTELTTLETKWSSSMGEPAK